MTEAPKMLKHTTRTIARIQQIPTESLGGKIKKTVVGVGIVAFGLYGARGIGFPWYVTVALVILGATIWSSELMVFPFKLFASFLGDVLASLRGQKKEGE